MILRTSRDVGATVRAERRRRGIDQKDLAAKAGVSRQWLIGLERGKAGVSLGLVLRVFNALGIKLAAETGDRAHGAGTEDFAGTAIDLDAIVDGARRSKG